MVWKNGKEARKEGPEYLADRHHSLLFPAVSHGDQVMQESSVIANGEDEDNLHSKEQHSLFLSDDKEGKCPIEITQSVTSDEKHISFPARKGSAILSPMEDSKMQNVSSQGRPNMVGIVANLKVNAVKAKPKVQRMPAIDRNYESLTPEELQRSQRHMWQERK